MAMIYEPRGKAREYAPRAANHYSGCAHGCLYCYAPSALRRDRADFHAHPTWREGAIEQLDKDAAKLQAAGYTGSVLFCFTTDPYQPLDCTAKLTRLGIKTLHAHGLSVEILTKGGRRAERDFDLLTPADRFATTLTFLDEADSLNWEPGAALPDDRIAAIERAKSLGLTTWASLEPVIDPVQSLEIIGRTADCIDLFKVGKLNHHPLAATIDWADFARAAVALLEKLGKAYYIKDDLRKYL